MKNLISYNIVFVLIFIAVFSYAQDNLTGAEIKVEQLTENISKLICSYSDKAEVNVTVCTGKDGILLVDTGRIDSSVELKSTLQTLSTQKVAMIINTHMHQDHVGANDLFGKDAIIVAHRNTGRRLLQTKAVSKDGLPDTIINDEMAIEFNGEKIKLIHLPGGHSDGDLIVHFTQSKIVCVGDLLFADWFPYVSLLTGGDVEQYAKNVETIINTFPSDVTLIAGHGRNYTVDELKVYHEMLIKTIRIIKDEMKKGKTAEEMIPDNLLVGWEAWGNGPIVSLNDWIERVYESLSNKQK